MEYLLSQMTIIYSDLILIIFIVMKYIHMRHVNEISYNLKMKAMKKLLLFAALMITITVASGQKSIDRLFEKYAGRDGFTTVSINGDLLKLAASLDKDIDENDFPASITDIRILAQEDNNLKVENFYEMIIKDLDLTDYEEFMQVKESGHNLRMLVRAEGNKFREFLLIAGGEKDNAVIQIKGRMSFAEARKFSDDAKKKHGLNIFANHK